MGDDTTMTVVEQREVVFYGDALSAARGDDGRVYVNFAQVCDALGIDARAQRRRVADHDVMGAALAAAVMPTAGGPQRVTVIRADMVPLWLSTVRAAAVREELREKLRRFQREAAVVLWEAFREGRLTVEPDDDATAGVSPEALQALQTAEAVLLLARSQVAMERRLSGQLGAIEARLETVEAALGDTGRHVTPDQAAQLSQAVKAVAFALGRKTGRNEHQGVYGEFYRRYGITSYKLLPARRFEEAMRWLTEWHGNVSDQGALPF